VWFEKIDDGFKTLCKNMLALRHLGENLILVYVKHLNPFCNIFAQPPVFKWKCQTIHRHDLNASDAIIHAQKKAAFCNIMIRPSTKPK
jgi:hypothetical protein